MMYAVYWIMYLLAPSKTKRLGKVPSEQEFEAPALKAMTTGKLFRYVNPWENQLSTNSKILTSIAIACRGAKLPTSWNHTGGVSVICQG